MASQAPRQQNALPSHPTFNSTNFYANSAPNSSVGFTPSPSTTTRPPVPLFHHSAGNVPQQPQHQRPVFSTAGNMATGNHYFNALRQRALSSNTTKADMDLFADLNSTGYGQLDQNDLFDWDQTAQTTFTAVNANDTPRTVSPKDIMNDPLASAPASTAFTNLTSPDINESPYICDSYETSPMFAGDLTGVGADNWYPLFPDAQGAGHGTAPAMETQPSMERTVSQQSVAQSSSSNASNSPIVLDVSHRRKSSTHSPAGVTKQRRRKGPLPPIEVDPQDKTALKRARNTLAARESRQRKFDHVQDLQQQIAILKAENSELQKWKAVGLQFGLSPPVTAEDAAGSGSAE